MGNSQIPKKELSSYSEKGLKKLFDKHIESKGLLGLRFDQDGRILQFTKSISTFVKEGGDGVIYDQFPKHQPFLNGTKTWDYISRLRVADRVAYGDFLFVAKTPTSSKTWFHVEDIEILYNKTSKQKEYMCSCTYVEKKVKSATKAEKEFKKLSKNIENIKKEIGEIQERIEMQATITEHMKEINLKVKSLTLDNAQQAGKNQSLKKEVRKLEEQAIQAHKQLYKNARLQHRQAFENSKQKLYELNMSKISSLEESAKALRAELEESQTIEKRYAELAERSKRVYRDLLDSDSALHQREKLIQQSRRRARYENLIAAYRAYLDANLDSRQIMDGYYRESRRNRLLHHRLLGPEAREFLRSCRRALDRGLERVLHHKKSPISREVRSKSYLKSQSPGSLLRSSNSFRFANSGPNGSPSSGGISRLASFSNLLSSASTISMDENSEDKDAVPGTKRLNRALGNFSQLFTRPYLASAFLEFLLPHFRAHELYFLMDSKQFSDMEMFTRYYTADASSFFYVGHVTLKKVKSRLLQIFKSDQFKSFAQRYYRPLYNSRAIATSLEHVKVYSGGARSDAGDANSVFDPNPWYKDTQFHIPDYRYEPNQIYTLPGGSTVSIAEIPGIAQFIVDSLRNFSSETLDGPADGLDVSPPDGKSYKMDGDFKVDLAKFRCTYEATRIFRLVHKLQNFDWTAVEKSRDEIKTVFWVNLHNIIVLYQIIWAAQTPDANTVKSFERNQFSVGKYRISILTTMFMLGLREKDASGSRSSIPENLYAEKNDLLPETILNLSLPKYQIIGSSLGIGGSGVERLKEIARARVRSLSRYSEDRLVLMPLFEFIKKRVGSQTLKSFIFGTLKSINPDTIKIEIRRSPLWPRTLSFVSE